MSCDISKSTGDIGGKVLLMLNECSIIHAMMTICYKSKYKAVFNHGVSHLILLNFRPVLHLCWHSDVTSVVICVLI